MQKTWMTAININVWLHELMMINIRMKKLCNLVLKLKDLITEYLSGILQAGISQHGVCY